MSKTTVIASVAIAILIAVVAYYAIRPGNRTSKPEVLSASSASTDRPADPNEALSQLVWLEPEANQFNMRVLDCRPFCTTMVSSTRDPKIAETFAVGRRSTGEQYRGKLPANHLSVQTEQRYPHDGNPLADGAVFLAKVMEDKWDIFLHEGQLYFARSWTGQLHFRATIQFFEQEAVVTNVKANSETVDGDPTMAIQVLDFIIKTHLYRLECPHPVLRSMEDKDDRTIAIWSFQNFGCRGCFATFDDTTSVRVPR